MHMDDDDPFDSVAKEVGESLIKTEQNLTSWCKNVGSLLKNNLKISKKNVLLDEFSSHQTDLKQLEWDIAELREVVGVSKSNPDQFNLLENDVLNRDTVIQKMEFRLSSMRKTIDAMDLKNKLETPNEETPLSRFETEGQKQNHRQKSHNSSINDKSSREKSTPDDFIGGAWSQRQQQIIGDQDKNLDKIGESVGALKMMSYNIGEELESQSKMLDDLGNGMETANSKTEQVLKRMAQVAHLDSDKRQWYAIAWLAVAIVVLFFLNIIW
jgi:syntaxin 6